VSNRTLWLFWVVVLAAVALVGIYYEPQLGQYPPCGVGIDLPNDHPVSLEYEGGVE
jgi:hypothetical protein